jgi:ribosomal 30S subunit maturation factor RimM
VLTSNGEPVGIVKDILLIPKNELLVVERGKQEFLIPLSGGICLEINPADRKIIIDPPAGLLDLNEI